jgi:hypothetical protein
VGVLVSLHVNMFDLKQYSCVFPVSWGYTDWGCLWFLLLQAEVGKKRSAESASKNPVPDKKAKFVTPQKTGDFLSRCLSFLLKG